MYIRSLVLVVVFVFFLQPCQAAMDKGYYSNSRDICQLHVQIKAGKRLPIDKSRASIAKVTPINKGMNLEVRAWDESAGKIYECICIFGPGDADLYPSVRIAGQPNCSSK
jgi:hypothetical protein